MRHSIMFAALFGGCADEVAATDPPGPCPGRAEALPEMEACFEPIVSAVEACALPEDGTFDEALWSCTTPSGDEVRLGQPLRFRVHEGEQIELLAPFTATIFTGGSECARLDTMFEYDGHQTFTVDGATASAHAFGGAYTCGDLDPLFAADLDCRDYRIQVPYHQLTIADDRLVAVSLLARDGSRIFRCETPMVLGD